MCRWLCSKHALRQNTSLTESQLLGSLGQSRFMSPLATWCRSTPDSDFSVTFHALAKATYHEQCVAIITARLANERGYEGLIQNENVGRHGKLHFALMLVGFGSHFRFLGVGGGSTVYGLTESTGDKPVVAISLPCELNVIYPLAEGTALVVTTYLHCTSL